LLENNREPTTKLNKCISGDKVDKVISAFKLCFMIELTERAAKQIEKLRLEKANEGELLKLLVKSGGCSGFEYGMTFTTPGEGDEIIEAHGVRVCIDPASLSKMDGSQIDFDDGLHGKGFEIHNPLAESTCGCGRSFA
jgi:iron-sulfur cluster assembly accessory protein